MGKLLEIATNNYLKVVAVIVVSAFVIGLAVTIDIVEPDSNTEAVETKASPEDIASAYHSLDEYMKTQTVNKGTISVNNADAVANELQSRMDGIDAQYSEPLFNRDGNMTTDELLKSEASEEVAAKDKETVLQSLTRLIDEIEWSLHNNPNQPELTVKHDNLVLCRSAYTKLLDTEHPENLEQITSAELDAVASTFGEKQKQQILVTKAMTQMRTSFDTNYTLDLSNIDDEGRPIINGVSWLNAGGYCGWIKIKWTNPDGSIGSNNKASGEKCLAQVADISFNGRGIQENAKVQFAVNVRVGKDSQWSDAFTYRSTVDSALGFSTNGTVFKHPATNIDIAGTNAQVKTALSNKSKDICKMIGMIVGGILIAIAAAVITALTFGAAAPAAAAVTAALVVGIVTAAVSIVTDVAMAAALNDTNINDVDLDVQPRNEHDFILAPSHQQSQKYNFKNKDAKYGFDFYGGYAVKGFSYVSTGFYNSKPVVNWIHTNTDGTTIQCNRAVGSSLRLGKSTVQEDMPKSQGDGKGCNAGVLNDDELWITADVAAGDDRETDGKHFVYSSESTEMLGYVAQGQTYTGDKKMHLVGFGSSANVAGAMGQYISQAKSEFLNTMISLAVNVAMIGVGVALSLLIAVVKGAAAVGENGVRAGLEGAKSASRRFFGKGISVSLTTAEGIVAKIEGTNPELYDRLLNFERGHLAHVENTAVSLGNAAGRATCRNALVRQIADGTVGKILASNTQAGYGTGIIADLFDFGSKEVSQTIRFFQQAGRGFADANAALLPGAEGAAGINDPMMRSVFDEIMTNTGGFVEFAQEWSSGNWILDGVEYTTREEVIQAAHAKLPWYVPNATNDEMYENFVRLVNSGMTTIRNAGFNPSELIFFGKNGDSPLRTISSNGNYIYYSGDALKSYQKILNSKIARMFFDISLKQIKSVSLSFSIVSELTHNIEDMIYYQAQDQRLMTYTHQTDKLYTDSYDHTFDSPFDLPSTSKQSLYSVIYITNKLTQTERDLEKKAKLIALRDQSMFNLREMLDQEPAQATIGKFSFAIDSHIPYNHLGVDVQRKLDQAVNLIYSADYSNHKQEIVDAIDYLKDYVDSTQVSDFLKEFSGVLFGSANGYIQHIASWGSGYGPQRSDIRYENIKLDEACDLSKQNAQVENWYSCDVDFGGNYAPNGLDYKITLPLNATIDSADPRIVGQKVEGANQILIIKADTGFTSRYLDFKFAINEEVQGQIALEDKDNNILQSTDIFATINFTNLQKADYAKLLCGVNANNLYVKNDKTLQCLAKSSTGAKNYNFSVIDSNGKELFARTELKDNGLGASVTDSTTIDFSRLRDYDGDVILQLKNGIQVIDKIELKVGREITTVQNVDCIDSVQLVQGGWEKCIVNLNGRYATNPFKVSLKLDSAVSTIDFPDSWNLENVVDEEDGWKVYSFGAGFYDGKMTYNQIATSDQLSQGLVRLNSDQPVDVGLVKDIPNPNGLKFDKTYFVCLELDVVASTSHVKCWLVNPEANAINGTLSFSGFQEKVPVDQELHIEKGSSSGFYVYFDIEKDKPVITFNKVITPAIPDWDEVCSVDTYIENAGLTQTQIEEVKRRLTELHGNFHGYVGIEVDEKGEPTGNHVCRLKEGDPNGDGAVWKKYGYPDWMITHKGSPAVIETSSYNVIGER